MISRCNCWEFRKCVKGPSENGSGKKERCPVVFEIAAHTLNGGTNGGRICWIVAESKYRGVIKCSEYHSGDFCFQCEFRYKVMIEEGLLETCHATGALLLEYEREIEYPSKRL